MNLQDIQFNKKEPMYPQLSRYIKKLILADELKHDEGICKGVSDKRPGFSADDCLAYKAMEHVIFISIKCIAYAIQKGDCDERDSLIY